MANDTISTLAAFKRALTIGSEWQHRWRNTTPQGITESPWDYRQVVHVQSNAVAFSKSPDPAVVEASKSRPHANASWLWHPKADRCSFTADGIIRIGDSDGGYVMEYRRLPIQTVHAGEAA